MYTIWPSLHTVQMSFTHRYAQGSRFSQKFRLKVLTIVADVLELTAGYKFGYLLTVCHLLL